MTDTDPRVETDGKIDERAAETELVRRIRRAGFAQDTPEWLALRDALVEYGYVVLVAWAVTGELGRRVHRHGGIGRRRVPAGLVLHPDAAHSLAVEVLIVSTEKFRTASLRSWDPAGRASLRTFFVGRCLLDLPDVYARWKRDQSAPTTPEAELPDDGRHCVRPEEVVEARLLVDELLDGDPELRVVLELREMGYLFCEIAPMLGDRTAALRSRTWRALYRLRKEGI